ncbi:uracil-DNA glycosylase [Labrys miyagiensis]
MSAELEALLSELRACRICRDSPRYGPALPHEPRPVIQASTQARLCIVGQAPGIRVHNTGRPFNDPSGVRLRGWLGIGEDLFYDGAKVAIVPMGFCFPGFDAKGGDLPPRRECADAWRRRLFELMPNIELMLLIGHHAQKWHLRSRALAGGMTGTVARWRTILGDEAHPRMLVLPHPSWRNSGWLKRNAWFEQDLLPVLRAEVTRLLG